MVSPVSLCPGGETESEKRIGRPDLNRLALARAGDANSLSGKFLESFLASHQFVSPVAVNQNVPCAFPHTQARALGWIQARVPDVASATARIGDNSLIAFARRGRRNGWLLSLRLGVGVLPIRECGRSGGHNDRKRERLRRLPAAGMSR